ncbi:hypothetical protein RJ639_030167 [Escallonia herrerae]|uniref:Uncharacterized protein n=1 Tax=Escallonia herrerae TaxID=1293975 RepID=A0AA88X8D1_9ASTE|nr:hypothetical protein RJ639_030167 [Escallonia herrerae]
MGKAKACHGTEQLQNLHKGFLSIVDYLRNAKTVANQLSIFRQPISDADLGLHTLTGLSLEYDSIVTALTIFSGRPSFTEVYSFLLIHEDQLECQLTNHVTASSPPRPPLLKDTSYHSLEGRALSLSYYPLHLDVVFVCLTLAYAPLSSTSACPQ